MAITVFKRYEKKFLLTQNQYNMLLPMLLEYMDLDEHCLNGNDYTIYNIYYDTDNNDIINHSQAKPYYKEKLRLRSYKEIKSKDEKVFLELKKKIKGIVSKRRVVLPIKDVDNFLLNRKRPNTDDYLTNQVLNEIEYFLDNNNVHPAVVINYKRMALFGKDDRDFRITFDTRIMTRRYNFILGGADSGEDLLQEGQRLMEVKVLGAIPLWFVEIITELSIFPRGFSKYGNEFDNYCINKQYGEERRNKIC